MTSGESSLRMPKEATCDVECAMKVEEIRILNKKRKQSQRVGGGGSNGAATSKGAVGNGKSAKRPLPNGSGCVEGSIAKGGGGGGSGSSSGQQLGESSAAPSSKETKDAARRRFVWSVPLHQDFVAAVFDVGLKCASPKLLLEMMPVVDGLTSEHIKSHLQKYRLHRQRSREEFLKSYNYLTDLDGGKGLGGGSAAATVARAAAAAAGGGGGSGSGGVSDDSKRQFSGSVKNQEPAGCGSSCDCNDASTRGGGGGGGEVEEDRQRTALAKSASRDEGAERSGGSGVKARARQPDGGVEAVSELKRLPHVGAAPGEAANGSLLLAYLELLAKGINMQVKFHSHLRDVVESQQELHAQLVQQQRNGQLRQHPADFTGSIPRIVPSSTAGEATPPASDFSLPALQLQQDAVGGGVRVEDQGQAPSEVSSLVGDCSRPGAGYRTLFGPGKATPAAAGSLDWSGAGAGTHTPDGSPAAPAATKRGERGAAAQTPRRRKQPIGLNHAGAVQSEAAAAAAAVAATDVSVDSARDATAGRASVRGDQVGELDDAQQHQPQEHQFNPVAMREAFSVQTVAGGVLLPPGLRSAGRQASGVGSQGYVPGEYTLASKTSETGGAWSGASHVHGQAAAYRGVGGGRLGEHSSAVFAARSPAEARAALAIPAAGLALPTTTAAGGQETLTLQRHMQAQMSMQQSMLSACNDQATNFGQRSWCGGAGMPPAFAPRGESAGASVSRRSSSGGADGTEAGREGSGDGGGGGSSGSGVVGDGVGNKEQRLDTLALRPPDAGGDSSAMMGMGLLHQDDMFDFGMLDRDGELKSGDAPAGAAPGRPPGNDHSTLFSFLME